MLFDLHLLKINPRSLCVEIDPMALYRSYNRRQLAADFRLVAGAPGPRRTAEGYLMVALLDQQGE